jgi:hypothetical protein
MMVRSRSAGIRTIDVPWVVGGIDRFGPGGWCTREPLHQHRAAVPVKAQHDGVLDRAVGAFEHEPVHDLSGSGALGTVDQLDGELRHDVLFGRD